MPSRNATLACSGVLASGVCVVLVRQLAHKAQTIGSLGYACLRNRTTGKERIIRGPRLLFPSVFEELIDIGEAICLSSSEYAIVEDRMSGSRHVVQGPCTWFPEHTQEVAEKFKAISLTKTEYVIVEHILSGEKTMVQGPCLFIPGAYESGCKQSAVVLQDDEYVILKDTTTGHRWVQQGRALLFLQPTWVLERDGHHHRGCHQELGIRKSITLQCNEYVRLLNRQTGKVSIHRGVAVVVPTADEDILGGGKQQATMIDGEHAALVRDLDTGELRLVQERQWFVPGPSEELVEVREPVKLQEQDFAKVEDRVTGEVRVVVGPALFFVGPHERVAHTGQGISLGKVDYAVVEDQLSGDKHVVRGPTVWFPGPHEVACKGTAHILSKTEYIQVEDHLSGNMKTVVGPAVWFPNPYDKASKTQQALVLQDDEYVIMRNNATGKRWTQRGPDLVFPEPTWHVEGLTPGGKTSAIKKAIALRAHEYVRLVNTTTGKVEVHRGEANVFPGADDKVLDEGKKEAVEIDGEHAALVRDLNTGQLKLVTEQQLFVPAPNESVEEVRTLIKLAEHEAMIIKDREGIHHFHYGSEERRDQNQPRSFFLPPYAEIVQIWWSRGPRREKREYSFERFDMRPHFMKFEFNCRTADNVELVLEGVYFWQLIDLPAMFRMTGDLSGDMVNHLRSQFIQHVSRVTLKSFMEEQHNIAASVLQADEDFYTARGIKVYSLELTRYQCVDRSTSEILEQIIQETTNRMNRLSQAESENEVDLYKLQGQLEHAKLSGQLHELQRAKAEAEAELQGRSEAEKVAKFLQGLENDVPSLEDRIKMWQTLRKTDALTVLATGGANLYFTPNDVDLSIETRGWRGQSGPQAGGPTTATTGGG